MVQANRPRPPCPICGEPVAMAVDLVTEGGTGWVAEHDGGERCPITDAQLQALTEYAGLMAPAQGHEGDSAPEGGKPN